MWFRCPRVWLKLVSVNFNTFGCQNYIYFYYYSQNYCYNCDPQFYISLYLSMFEWVTEKLTSSKRLKKGPHKATGQSLRQKCLQITKQFPILAPSAYFNNYLPLLVSQQSVSSVLQEKITKIQSGIKQHPLIQMQLASIILNICEEDGLFFMFVKSWVSAFCLFELQKILKNLEDQAKTQKETMSDSQQQKAEKTNFTKLDQLKTEKIRKFFHREFFLLCYFILKLCLYLYSSCLLQSKQYQEHQLFVLIRNTVTSVRNFSQIHEIFRQHVNCLKLDFSQNQIEQNMKQLDKICLISSIPAPFMQSTNLLNEFCKIPDVEKKLQRSTKLISKIKLQMQEYRVVNQMKKDYAFCADDVLTALTFAMWRLRKNIFGPCVFVETVLCCEYEQIDEERLAEELNKLGNSTRHSFDTLRAAARIGLLQAQKIYSLS